MVSFVQGKISTFQIGVLLRKNTAMVHSVIEGIKLVKDLCGCISISKGCVNIRWKISDPRVL